VRWAGECPLTAQDRLPGHRLGPGEPPRLKAERHGAGQRRHVEVPAIDQLPEADGQVGGGLAVDGQAEQVTIEARLRSPGRWGTAGSGCSVRPCHYSSITLGGPGGLRERAQSRYGVR
jgi:hypothetical protein